MANSVLITVPATTANVGPAFDALGIALSLTLVVEATFPTPATSIVHFPESDGVPTDPERNLIAQTAIFVARSLKRSLPNYALRVTNNIPLSRGLGSSASALVAGVLLANALLKLDLTQQRVLEFVSVIEGHPDNVAPALLGGCVSSIISDALHALHLQVADYWTTSLLPKIPANSPQFQIPVLPPSVSSAPMVSSLSIPLPESITFLAFVPDYSLPTTLSRSVLPDVYPKHDVIFNLQRVAILVGALTLGAATPPLAKSISNSCLPLWTTHLRLALTDRIHQPHRTSLIPGFDALQIVIQEINASTPIHPLSNLLGIVLSGAGPTLLAILASPDTNGIVAQHVKSVLEKYNVPEYARRKGLGGEAEKERRVCIDVVELSVAGGATTEYLA